MESLAKNTWKIQSTWMLDLVRFSVYTYPFTFAIQTAWFFLIDIAVFEA